MMLKCVMAKNCNIKCPAGLTTNAEAFEGDPRALAQYLINVAHEVREILASLGLTSLEQARGRTDLLQLLKHPNNRRYRTLRVSNPIVASRVLSCDAASRFLADIGFVEADGSVGWPQNLSRALISQYLAMPWTADCGPQHSLAGGGHVHLNAALIIR